MVGLVNVELRARERLCNIVATSGDMFLGEGLPAPFSRRSRIAFIAMPARNILMYLAEVQSFEVAQP